MNKKERYKHFIEYFVNNFPDPQTELKYQNPYQLLVAVILSAQCTDKRINMVTPPLFERYPTPQKMAESSVEEIFEYIKSVSYPNNKAKHLFGAANLLVQNYNSEIPADHNELIKLPGVGRKTANVIISVIFNQPAIAVDTHVFRVSHRLGLVNKKDNTPLAVEKELVKNIEGQYLARAHHWLILHGRYICVARSPKCEQCPLTSFCLYYEKKVSKLLSNEIVSGKVKFN